jgi:indole-3-acetate monooxygenase
MSSTNVTLAFEPSTVADLIALARETAADSEANGRVAPAFVDLMRRVGSSTAPASHGGSNPPLFDVLDLIRLVAKGDGSAGWVAMIYLTSAVGLHWLEEGGRDDVLANGANTLVAGVLAPKGVAVSKAGGFEVTGRWAFGSGSADADWMGLGAVIDGSPARTGIFFIPRDQIQILPTWQVVGLRATASNDQLVENTFVPARRVAYFDGPNLTAEPVATFPILGLLAAGIGAVAIGIAEAALEEFTELSGAKTPTGSKRRLADRGSAQEAVSRAHAGIESAWHYLARRSLDISEIANRGDKVRLRLAATAAVETSRQIVDSLYTLAGGSSLYERSPLQRHFRDIHTATQHMMVGQPTWELTGRVLLGLETDPAGL